NQKQIRFEGDQLIERTSGNLQNSLARCVRRDGIIVDVCERFRSSPGISGELMNRGKSNPLIACDNRFGPVPVMSIKIPNGNTVALCCSRGRLVRRSLGEAG